LQESAVHGLLSLQLSAVPTVHDPFWQVSLPLQRFPSAQEVPLRAAVCVQPKTGSQASLVQGLPSSQLSGVPPVHVPFWQVSAPLQRVPSGQEVPLAALVCWQPSRGSQESVVHGLPSLQSSAVPAVHVPPWQVSAPSQTVPS